MSEEEEMPRYECHKKVWALKISEIEYSQGEPDTVFANITPAEEGYSKFVVDEEYLNRHKPKVGGYYVVYEDGYKSFSPAAAFEGGYTRMN